MLTGYRFAGMQINYHLFYPDWTCLRLKGPQATGWVQVCSMCLSSEACDKEVQLPVTCCFNGVTKVHEGKLNPISRVGKYEGSIVNNMGNGIDK